MTQKYQVKVSMKQAAIVETGIVLKQGDFGMQIEIEVLDFDATGTTPQIVFRKAMGAVESTTISVSGNKYTYTFVGTELDTPGKVFCDLKLKNSTTQRISTASFMFKVVADTMDGLAEEASSYSDTIEQIVGGFDDDIDAINDHLEYLDDALESLDELVGECTHIYIQKYGHAEAESANYLTSGYIPIVKDRIYYLTASKQEGNAYDTSLNIYDTSKTFYQYKLDTFSNTEWAAPIDGYIRLTNFSTTTNPSCKTYQISIKEQIANKIDKISGTAGNVSKIDASGNLEDSGIPASSILKNTDIDATLTTTGKAADAKATGDAIGTINSALESLENLVTTVTNVYINKYSHEETANANYKTSDYIPVEAGKIYYLTGNRQDGNAYDSSLHVYDTSKTFYQYKVDTYDNTEWTAPINGYIRITSYDAPAPMVKTNLIQVTENIEELQEETSYLLKENDKFAGKTIIWFGTSIPAGQKTREVTVDGITAYNNYPDMIGKLLKCTVINQAVGTSCAKTGKPANVTEQDPMGVKGVQYEMATRALTQTLAEKNDFVDNWTTKYGPGGTLELWGSQSNPLPATLPQYQKDVILGSSYETLLIPYLNGTYPMPDYFVFDHGYNDGGYYTAQTSNEMLEIPTPKDDRHYYIGALNLLFDMILTANPKAKIFLIDHFCSQDRPWVAEAQNIVSEEWEFPSCELYKISGMSMQEITVNNETVTIKKVYCPDGVHPHSDLTGETNMLLARKLATWLKSVI